MAAAPFDVLTLAAPLEQGRNVIFYLHGESDGRKTLQSEVPLLAFLARQTGCSVVTPRYPGVLHASSGSLLTTVECFYQAVAAQVGAGNVLLMGYGAGAGLALTLVQRRRAAGGVLPRHLLLLAPWLDIYLPAAAGWAETDCTDPPRLLGRMQQTAGYACDSQSHNPLHASLLGLPFTSIFATVRDRQHADALDLARRLFARQQPARLLIQTSPPCAWLLPDAAEAHEFRSLLVAELARQPNYL